MVTSPTRRDIMEHFHFKSTKGVADHLNALKKKGYLTQAGKGARSLEVKDLSVIYSFPIVRKVQMNRPITTEENLEGRLALDCKAAPWSDAFFIRAKEGMEKAGIFGGDYALICPQPSAQEGKLVSAALGGELLIRYFLRKKDTIFLCKEKADKTPIEIPVGKDDFRFLGKVVTVIRFTSGPLA